MAQTNFGALSDAQKRVWANQVSIAGRDQNFWMANGFVGRNTADMTRPVQRITELTQTERGLTVVMQLVTELQNDGVVGDNTLEGNEEPLVNDAVEVNVDQLRHGVRSKGRVAEQSTVIRFRNVARDKLGFWLGDTIDELMFLTAAGRSYSFTTGGVARVNSQLPAISFAGDVVPASSNRKAFITGSSEGDVVAGDKMNWNLLVGVQAFAKRKRIKPIRAGGKVYYAIVMSTEQMRDLKQDQTYQDLVAKGHVRGPNNPLFNNASAVVDGLILYEHPKVYNTLDAVSGTGKWGSGNDIDGAQAMLIGAQSLGMAMIGNAEWHESDNTDYQNRPGVAYGRMIGMLKPQFKSIYDGLVKEDFGVISIFTAAAQSSLS